MTTFILPAMRSVAALLLVLCLLVADGWAQAGDPLQQGMDYYTKGDFARARQEFEAAHVAHPENVRTAVLLASAYIKLQRFAQATALLSPLEKGNESNAELEYALAFALIQSGKADDGLPRMEKMAAATRNAGAYVIAGSARLARQEYNEAQADAEAAFKLNAAVPGLYTLLGQTRYANGDVDKAVTAYQAALRENPQDFFANLYLGVIRLKQRDFDNARPLLELALQLRPKYPLARYEVAKLYAETGREDEELAALEALVKDEPQWIEPRWMLSNLYFRRNRPADGQRERTEIQRLTNQSQKPKPER